MRRVAALSGPILVPLALALLAVPTPDAGAQEAQPVRLTLLSQTPWNSTAQPSVDLRFRAENLGELPFGELTIGTTLYSRLLTRGGYERSLIADPAVVIDAETLPREGVLDPGGVRDFEISFPLDSGIDPDQSGVYPFKIDLRSAGIPLAELRTAVVFLVRDPEVPVLLSWTFVLDHPISFGPDGTFVDDSLERTLGPGGTLHGQLRALRELAERSEASVDVAVSPLLLTQLGRMRDGYAVASPEGVRSVAEGEGGAALAEAALEDLRTIAAAPGVRISALPFSSPEIPALYAGGLGRDVGVQLERGREVVGAFLQASPVPGILRPPGGALDEPSLKGLVASGIATVIVDPETVARPPQPLDLTGPATAILGEGPLRAILPDPSTDAVIAQVAPDDPVRGAVVALGELAAIWQERPGERRGVAIVFDEDLPLPGSFFVAFARAVADAPWLDTVSAAEMLAAFPPIEPSTIAVPSLRRFGESYVDELKQARRRVDTLRSMLPEASERPAVLETMLLLAESRPFLSAPAEGLVFIAAVRDEVGATLGALELETVSPVTLTSASGGGIPVTVTNGAQSTLRLSVRLVSQHLRETLSSEVELPPGASETIRFQARLRSTGRFPVLVQIVSPGGRVIEEVEIVVRSTVYNRIALVITVGAALVLLLVWARRFLPRASR